MKSKSLYIFDFGDTLVSYPLDTWDNQISFIESFLQSFVKCRNINVKSDTLKEMAKKLNVERADMVTVPFAERVKKEDFFGKILSPQELLELESDMVRAVCNMAKVYDDTRKTIEELRKQNKLIAIMSNLPWGTRSSVWKAEFERHGFEEGKNVDKIVCCMDIGFRKPHPEGINCIITKLEKLPADAVFIGDNPVADREAAMNAECDFIMIDRGHHKAPANTRVIRSLTELIHD